MVEIREVFVLLDRIKKLEAEPYKIGADMYDIIRRMPKMSLARLSNFLATQFTFRSARYFKVLYNINFHFCVKSGFRVDDLSGIDYRILKSIAETRIEIFDYDTTRWLVGKLEGDFINRRRAWQLVMETKSRRIKEIQYEKEKNQTRI